MQEKLVDTSFVRVKIVENDGDYYLAKRNKDGEFIDVGVHGNSFEDVKKSLKEEKVLKLLFGDDFETENALFIADEVSSSFQLPDTYKTSKRADSKEKSAVINTDMAMIKDYYNLIGISDTYVDDIKKLNETAQKLIEETSKTKELIKQEAIKNMGNFTGFKKAVEGNLAECKSLYETLRKTNQELEINSAKFNKFKKSFYKNCANLQVSVDTANKKGEKCTILTGKVDKFQNNIEFCEQVILNNKPKCQEQYKTASRSYKDILNYYTSTQNVVMDAEKVQNYQFA